MPCLRRMDYGHRHHHRSDTETCREVLLQPAMRAAMPGGLEDGEVEIAHLGLIMWRYWVMVKHTSSVYIPSMCRCIFQQKGGTPSQPANVSSQGTYSTPNIDPATISFFCLVSLACFFCIFCTWNARDIHTHRWMLSALPIQAAALLCLNLATPLVSKKRQLGGTKYSVPFVLHWTRRPWTPNRTLKSK